MIHKHLRNDYNFYAGRGLLDYFTTENTPISANGSYQLGWLSKLSSRCFWYKEGDTPSTQRIACELDADGIRSLSFRKGIYGNELAWWKFHTTHYTSEGKAVIPIGDYLNTTGFTIQMTCTYEAFANWGAIMGLHQANYPVGLSLGQYDNGIVSWGFYPVTVNGVANQHIRVDISSSLIPSVKFNWCFVYKQGTLSLYFNGYLKGTATMPAGWSWTTNTGIGALGLSLGYGYQGVNRHFKGSIYSLLMYNQALNENEIYQNYRYDKQKYLIPN